jgi:hypothetical protein
MQIPFVPLPIAGAGRSYYPPRSATRQQQFRFWCLQKLGAQVAFSLRKSHLAPTTNINK